MSDLRQAATADPTYPPVVIFFKGGVEAGKRFFAGSWPEARAVSDPDGLFYTFFDLKRGGLRAFITPDVLRAGARAMAKGHGGGMPTSDPLQMPGLALVAGPEVLWQYHYQHVGDNPNFAALPARIAADRA